jgi:hypothetical protein
VPLGGTRDSHRDYSIHIEITNMHCQGIACTRSFGMGLSLAEGQILGHYNTYNDFTYNDFTNNDFFIMTLLIMTLLIMILLIMILLIMDLLIMTLLIMTTYNNYTSSPAFKLVFFYFFTVISKFIYKKN